MVKRSALVKGSFFYNYDDDNEHNVSIQNRQDINNNYGGWTPFRSLRKRTTTSLFMILLVIILIIGLALMYSIDIQSKGVINESMKRETQKDYAIVIFLTSCSEKTYCELGMTLLQSIIDNNVHQQADIIVLLMKGEEGVDHEIVQDFKMIYKDVIVRESTVPANPPKEVKGFIENTDFLKLVVWQYIEYKRIILLDADTLIVRHSVTELFLSPEYNHSQLVSSSGGFSPLNCGFFSLQPSIETYNEMVSIIRNPSLFSFETGWNHTGIRGFKGGMKGKLPSAATCQGFLYYYFYLKPLQDSMSPPLAIELPPGYICDCTCLKSNDSLEQRLDIKMIHFSGPCKPFPLPRPVKVRLQQRIQATFPMAKESINRWEAIHLTALSKLGDSTNVSRRGYGTHLLVSQLETTGDDPSGTSDEEG